jgi:NAD(P)-dependent dehydrogenase (short-subunit alcohol dehydrogenase family)
MEFHDNSLRSDAMRMTPANQGWGFSPAAKVGYDFTRVISGGFEYYADYVSDDAQVEAMVQQTVAEFGQLDAAYNNAGIQNILAETTDSPRDDYDRVMSINLRGVWSCMKFELQQMRKQGRRRHGY